MSEATPEGTSILTTHSAVDLLLDQSAPVEDTADEREASTNVDNAEADEVEVQADEAEDIAEDIVQDDDAEAEPEAEEVIDEAETPRFRVRAGDDEVEVTLEELKNSYMRQADYTRKTQQIAEQRKAAEMELASATSERQRYAEQLAVLEQALSQQEPTQDYWNSLYQSDPLEYTRQRELTRDRKEALEQIKAEQVKVQNEQIAQMQAAAQQRLAQERERLPELIPEWLDGDVATREKAAVVTYAQRFGYTAEELSNVSDARAVALIRKAMKYDELMSMKPAAQKRASEAPKMTKSGQPTSKAQLSQRRRQQALANISKSKGRASMDAAVDFLLSK